MEETPAIAEVRQVFQRFHEGYVKRDLNGLDAFLADLFPRDDDQQIIGTGSDEWLFGLEGARDLVGSDWEFWGDVAFDVPAARISVRGDVAWIAAKGTVSRTIPVESFQQSTLDYVKELLQEGKGTVAERMLEVYRAANNTIYETSRGDRYIWPLRFTAVLVKEEGRWLFRQMQFSFATLRSPDERVVD